MPVCNFAHAKYMSGDFDCLLNFLAMGRGVFLYVKPKSG